MKRKILVLFLIITISLGLFYYFDTQKEKEIIDEKSDYDISKYETAIFAGGCFWCMEPPFEKLTGVVDAVSGYIGGTLENPTYKKVASGQTKHLEVVKVIYDPEKISYENLLDVFWRQINPTDDGGQFVDRGYQYTTAIFVKNEKERKLAKASKKKLRDSEIFDKEIVTPIRDATEFYKAEDYHQDYYIKSDVKYKYYRSKSGRDEFLDKIWE